MAVETLFVLAGALIAAAGNDAGDASGAAAPAPSGLCTSPRDRPVDVAGVNLIAQLVKNSDVGVGPILASRMGKTLDVRHEPPIPSDKIMTRDELLAAGGLEARGMEKAFSNLATETTVSVEGNCVLQTRRIRGALGGEKVDISMTLVIEVDKGVIVRTTNHVTPEQIALMRRGFAPPDGSTAQPAKP